MVARGWGQSESSYTSFELPAGAKGESTLGSFSLHRFREEGVEVGVRLKSCRSQTLKSRVGLPWWRSG